MRIKKKSEQERGIKEKRDKNWDNDDYFSKKGSKQGVEKTRKRHTLERRRFWQDDVHKKYVNNKKREQAGEKRQTNKEILKKREQEKTKGVTSFYKGVQKINWRRGSGNKGRVQRKREKLEEIKEKELEQREFWERRTKTAWQKETDETKQREETRITKGNKERIFFKNNEKTLT